MHKTKRGSGKQSSQKISERLLLLHMVEVGDSRSLQMPKKSRLLTPLSLYAVSIISLLIALWAITK
jgi:hypothetical protein